MGRLQVEKPLVGEEGVGPTVMVGSTAVSLQAETSTEDASHPHPYPSVQSGKRPLAAVFEVFKPAAERRRERRDDLGEAVAGGPFRLCPDRVLELVQTLRSRAADAVLESVAQEVKAFNLGVDVPFPLASRECAS